MSRIESESEKRTYSESEARQYYDDLLEKSLESIGDGGASIVLGPMFIIRSPEENFELFRSAQKHLRENGIDVFDQLPWLDYNLQNAPFMYDLKFEIYYKGLIRSGKIKGAYLLEGWEKSKGTRSEVEYCQDFGVPVYTMSDGKEMMEKLPPWQSLA